MRTGFMGRLTVGIVFLFCAIGTSTTVLGQGIMFPALGPVNRGMGGASVAAPLDAIGSLHWNPAAISGLGTSELEFGVELLLADLDATSSVGPFTGTTGAEPGVVPIPSIGWVHQSLTDSRLSYGLGVYAVGGFQTNYPASNPPPAPGANPILSPQPAGFGRIYSSAEFLQIVPTISYALTERLSIGFAPVATMGRIELSPFVLAPPTAGGFSSGQGNRWHWGGGAQLGVYYITENCWHLGASIKSPTWFERFRFHSEDRATGNPRVVTTELELPMIVSFGAAYSGYENLVLAMDVRYFGYERAKLLGDTAALAGGTLLGLGWDDVISVALGAQYLLNDFTYVRAGYSFNTNPIHSSNVSVNIASPLIYQHVINVGATRKITDCVSLNLSFLYSPENSVSGPLTTVPGTFSTSVAVYTLALGATVQY